MLGGSLVRRPTEQFRGALEQLRDSRAVCVSNGGDRKLDHPHRPTTGSLTSRWCRSAATRVVHLLAEDRCKAQCRRIELLAPREVLLNDCPHAVMVALENGPIGPNWTVHPNPGV